MAAVRTSRRRVAPGAPPLAGAADAALDALQRLPGARSVGRLSGADLLGERARLTGLRVGHRRSGSGACRLLDTAGTTLAVNLPRPEDWELVPAWLETAGTPHWTWQRLARALSGRDAAPLIERARLLGIAVAPVAAAPDPAPNYHHVTGPALGPVGPRRERPLVVDLSALWAGPLCGQLLRRCGAEVVKVECVRRPDGARAGNAAFYGSLNQGKRCLALDLAAADGRATLRRLLRAADIVIEGSRPRALRQMGIEVPELLHAKPDLTWVSITGYGRAEPRAGWVAFGDDAGVAAGLSDVMRRATGDCQLAGDAVADPLTGIRAALAAWRSWCGGGGRLLALALVDVAARSLHDEARRLGTPALERSFADWWAHGRARDPAPGARTPTARVGRPGEDNARILPQLAARC